VRRPLRAVILAVAGALLVGLSLGVFGSGGSILTVPVLVYALGHPDKQAIAESLGIVGAIALVSALPYARAGLVSWRTALVFGLPGMAGTYAGAWLAGYVAGVVQLVVFAGVMGLAARLMRRPTGPAAADASPAGPGGGGGVGGVGGGGRPIGRIGAEGLGVGVLTGFVGVGGGFLIVPALVLLGGLPMRAAVGTSLVVIALKSGAGFWKYTRVLPELGLGIDWATVGVFIAAGAAGSLAGRAINARVDQDRLRRGFAAFLAVMAVLVLTKELWDLAAGAAAPPPDAPAAARGGA